MTNNFAFVVVKLNLNYSLTSGLSFVFKENTYYKVKPFSTTRLVFHVTIQVVSNVLSVTVL